MAIGLSYFILLCQQFLKEEFFFFFWLDSSELEMLRISSLRPTKWNQLFSWLMYSSSTRLCFRPSVVKITHKL